MPPRDRTGSSRRHCFPLFRQPRRIRPASRPRPRAGPAQHRDSRPVTASYLERLAARVRTTGTVLCLGLDPDPASLPDGFSADIAGIERFATLLLEAVSGHASAVKPNLAFFEA